MSQPHVSMTRPGLDHARCVYCELIWFGDVSSSILGGCGSRPRTRTTPTRLVGITGCYRCCVLSWDAISGACKKWRLPYQGVMGSGFWGVLYDLVWVYVYIPRYVVFFSDVKEVWPSLPLRPAMGCWNPSNNKVSGKLLKHIKNSRAENIFIL